MNIRPTIAAGALLGAGSLLAAGALVACSSDDGPARVEPASGAPPDSGPSVDDGDPSDAGADVTDASVPDRRPPFDAAPPEVACAVTPCMKKIVAGPANYCATATDGVVRCWGSPRALGAFVDSADPNAGAVPVALEGIGEIVDVGISSYDTCVALSTGTVSCFGLFSAPTPTPIPGVNSARALAIGDYRQCAILATGELWCWGDGFYTGSDVGPTDLGGAHAVAAQMAFSVAFALDSDGTLYSWGSDPYALGRPTASSPDLTPAPVQALPPTIQFASSDAPHACALTFDGRVFCWGMGQNGQLGLGSLRNEYFPVEVAFPGDAYPSKIAVSMTHSCARMTDGSLTCWDRSNQFGELGSSSTNPAFVPTKVTSLTKKVVDVAVGFNSTCAVLEDGSVQCWGDNSSGQLAQSAPDSTPHHVPLTVAFP